jgi:2-deoxy-D-gluconate 3-dehydrogenase
MHAKFDLSGKTALVTGSTRGLGQAIAHGLALGGADIIGASASQARAGSETQRLVESAGRSFTGLGCDFSKRSDTYRLIDELLRMDRSIDIVVNNAGTIRRAPAIEHGDDDWDHVLEVNLTAPFILSRELAKPMLERGKIIFIASVLSFQGGITVPGYTSSKSAIVGLTKALASEWAGRGVNVNAIAPGYTRTDNTRTLQDDAARSEAIRNRIPAGDWGNPSDIAGAAVYLASSAADYVHGSVITVDGGWMAR